MLKRQINSSEVIATLIQNLLENNKLLASKLGDWTDEDVPVESYLREDCCLNVFIVFLAIVESRLSEREKKLLLTQFENQVIGLMESGRLDKKFYHDIQQYHDALDEPLPPHLDRSWNVGLAFARHCGAEKEIAYVAPAAASFGKSLQATIELLDSTSKSYRILEG